MNPASKIQNRFIFKKTMNNKRQRLIFINFGRIKNTRKRKEKSIN